MDFTTELPSRMIRWRHTVPAAIVAAESSAKTTARKVLCTMNDISEEGESTLLGRYS